MLRNVPLFSGLSAEELKTIETHSVSRSVRKNTVIIDKGDETSSIYVIESGKVKVYISDEEGKEIILNIQGKGEHLGELALLAGTNRTASVITLEDSKFIVISRQAFRECLNRHPEIAFNLIRTLAERVNALTDNVSSLALNDVYARVAAKLQEQATEQDGTLVIEQLTQQQLADMVGATRQMVSLILKDLRGGGYITIDKRRITINRKLPARW